jgi:hypothetical protein
MDLNTLSKGMAKHTTALCQIYVKCHHKWCQPTYLVSHKHMSPAAHSRTALQFLASVWF